MDTSIDDRKITANVLSNLLAGVTVDNQKFTAHILGSIVNRKINVHILSI